MSATPEFLQLLGLETDADAKSVRRAYARALKQVDQAGDIDGFQRLREAYEAALDWAGRQGVVPPAPPAGASAAPSYGPAAVPVTLRTAPPQPDAAEMACRRFDKAFRELGAHPELDAVLALLRQCLDDEALESLSARERFEEYIVARLVAGWQPGHQVLFPAAAGLFGWEQDPSRLRQFGHAGDQLNLALEQRVLFGQQDTVHQRIQRQLIARLRDRDLPPDADLLQGFANFERLAYYLAAWLCVIAPRDNVLRWQRRYDELGPERRASFDHPAVAPAEEKQRAWRNWWWLVLLIGPLLRLLEPSAPERLPQVPVQDSPSVYAPQGARKLPEDFRQRIRNRVAYRSPTGKVPGPVLYDVYIDADGNVTGMTKVQGSDDPAFERAVEQAVRAAQPFPRGLESPVYLFIEAPMY